MFSGSIFVELTHRIDYYSRDDSTLRLKPNFDGQNEYCLAVSSRLSNNASVNRPIPQRYLHAWKKHYQHMHYLCRSTKTATHTGTIMGPEPVASKSGIERTPPCHDLGNAYVLLDRALACLPWTRRNRDDRTKIDRGHHTSMSNKGAAWFNLYRLGLQSKWRS